MAEDQTASGMAEPGTRIDVAGGVRPVSAVANARLGVFSAAVELFKDKKHELKVVSEDKAGNRSLPATIIVTQTAKPPVFLSASQIRLVMGHLQRGVAGKDLPRPLEMIVTNDLGAPAHNVEIFGRGIRGGANFQGNKETRIRSGTDGHAFAVGMLGPQAGENIWEFTFAGNQGSAVLFAAEGLAAAPPDAPTTFRGLVLGPELQGIEGATLRWEGTSLETKSNGKGAFSFSNVPAGRQRLFIDGLTVTRPGPHANLLYELDILEGQENRIPGNLPIFLPPLDVESALEVSPTKGGVMTTELMPGLKLEVEPGSVTFPDGSRTGKLFLTVVPIARTPMPLPDGLFSRHVIAVQPGDSNFDPPIRVTFPNLDGLPPGKKTKLISFDHDVGRFIQVGTSTVTADGKFVVSDPGSGIKKGAWHSSPPPEPAPTTCVLVSFHGGVTDIIAILPNNSAPADVKECEAIICNVTLDPSIKLPLRVEALGDKLDVSISSPKLICVDVPSEHEMCMLKRGTPNNQKCRLTVTEGNAIISVPGQPEGSDVKFQHNTAEILKFTVEAKAAGTVTIEARCGDCPKEKPTPVSFTAIKVTLEPKSRRISASSPCADPKETKTKLAISVEPSELAGNVEVAINSGRGTLSRSSPTEALYEAFDEPLTELHPKAESVVIEAKVNGESCETRTITVRSAFEHLALSALAKGGVPGSGRLFQPAYDFIRCKYAAFLNGITFKGEKTAFASVQVADTRTVACRVGVFTFVDADACVDGDRNVIFGQNAFSTENAALTTIAHELLHTRTATEEEALQFELDNAAVTGISASEFNDIQKRLEGLR